MGDLCHFVTLLVHKTTFPHIFSALVGLCFLLLTILARRFLNYMQVLT